MAKEVIYLDYASASPMDPQVLAAMQPYFADTFYNPSAPYLAAKAVKADIEKARETVAHWFGARPSNIVFTSGGTEANNLAIVGIAGKHRGAHIISTAIEHESILKPLAYLKQLGWKYTLVAPKPDGIVDPTAIAKAITHRTVLVSVMYANNEIGTVQPLKEITAAVAAVRKQRQKTGNLLPLYVHTDACQAAAYLDLHVARLGVDLMTINGGKIYGPKQSGVLYINSHVDIGPVIFGGGQERGLRSGTENVGGIIGLATALDLVQNRRQAERTRLTELQDIFIKELADKLPVATINGSLHRRLPNNLHITIPGTDNERLLFALDSAGIQCAAGSACSASKEEASHVLRALGMNDYEARASLRFSMGRGTTEKDIRYTASTLAKIVA
jgi:cysteine desulfurase